MTERTRLTSVTQLGIESSPGTAVAALKRLMATDIRLQSDGNIDMFAPSGYKFDTIQAIGREWVKFDIAGFPSYNDLAYLFSSLISYAAPAQQGGTAAYLWTFTPSSTVEDTIKTFTIEEGSRVRAHRAPYGLVNGLEISFDRSKVDMKGDGIAQSMTDGINLSTNATYTLTADASPPTAGTFTLTKGAQTTAGIAFDATPAEVKSALEALSTVGAGNTTVTATVATGTGKLDTANNVYTIEFVNDLGQQAITLTGTFTSLTASNTISLAAGTVGVAVTEIAAKPILAKQFDVYMDDTSGALGGTKFTRVLSGSWRYGGRYAPLWAVNSAFSSFGAHYESKPEGKIMLTLEANSAGMEVLSRARDGATKFVRLVAQGDNIASSYYYKLQIDAAVKVSAMPALSDTEGLISVPWELAIVHDASWGKAMTIALTNVVTAL